MFRSFKLLLEIILILSLIGVALSGYLTYQHYSLIQNQEYTDPLAPFCSPDDRFSCEDVNTSIYSEIFGIPVALIGLIGFLIFMVTSVYGLLHLQGDLKPVISIVFIFSMIGLAFSAYLSYVELFILDLICLLCVAAAITNLGILTASIKMLTVFRAQ